MKKVIVFLAAILCLGVSTQTLAAVPPVEFQVELTDAKSEFFTVEVKGDAYQRGFQHGKALRKIIRPTINRFKYDMISVFLEAMGTELKWKDYRDFFYNNTGLLKNAQKYAPELVREIQGIADGAGLDFKDVFVYNLNFDETFWVLEKMTGIDPMLEMEKSTYPGALPDHCSHGSVWGKGKASVGYTLDWTRHFEGSQSLIKHVKEDGTVLLTTTYAGTLIGHGINATHGYTFTPHSKFQLEHDVDNGLAQIFIYRKLVEAGSVDKAIEFLKSIKPAAGLAYTLTDKNGTRVFEISANKITEFKTDGNWMAVANVARANNDLSRSYRKALALTGDVDMNKLPEAYWKLNHDSVDRFDMIAAGVKGKKPADMTPEVWEKIFIHPPLNKPVDEKLETSNLWHVVIIDEQYIDYYVSPGNPGNFSFENYRFKYK
jgi:predicted choloylglycine hydrolase